MKNPYETLGVEKDASDTEIKEAYRDLSKKYHPDKGGDSDIFTEVSVAYSVLKNPFKRKEFDETGNVKEERDENREVVEYLISMFATVFDGYDFELLKKINVIEKVMESIKNVQKESERSLKKAEKYNHKIRMFLSKLKYKKDAKHNYVSIAFEARQRQIEKTIELHEKQIRVCKKAKVMLQDFTYKFDKTETVYTNRYNYGRSPAPKNEFYNIFSPGV